ncbi:hypothetical protein ACH5RR_020687 [Cinchona calisaya]|uniref:ELM2 domain-containing protein n=1 Tax=Cinchona calisaya TaxID=153742 RepID=A0ABD2ZFA7_9GENT
MKPSKQLKVQISSDPVPKSWIEYICDDNLRLAIPVGPRFQADLPTLTVSPCNIGEHNIDSKSDSSKWSGTTVWPTVGRKKEAIGDVIGKGRPKSCRCISPGSVECIKSHINAQKIQLQSDLGPAFWKWKFDNMGEEVSKLWNLEEQKKLENVVKMHAKSFGESFIKSALEYLPCQSRETIVSYYLNVHIPGRIAKQTRLSSTTTRIDTDDEPEETPPTKGSRKRLQANHVTSHICKYAKTKYLMGRR